jgi:hypothetical protein
VCFWRIFGTQNRCEEEIILCISYNTKVSALQAWISMGLRTSTGLPVEEQKRMRREECLLLPKPLLAFFAKVQTNKKSF